MAGGGGSADGQGREWDVVLSFASAQRHYVEQVGRALKVRGVRCFYDADEQIGLWGKHLAEELPAIYGERAAAAVVFISAEYAARDWTRLERRAALARAVRERQEYVLPARFDDTPLPGLLPDVATIDLHRYTPEQFAGLVADKLAALGILAGAVAGGLAQDGGMVRPTGAVRAGAADLRRLGVHAAIRVPGVPEEVPPEYVPRDADAGGHGVRDLVAAAAQQGGFVLLVGGSSVGKTRCAAEAVKELLPDWWLVHLAGPGEVAALAAAPPGRVVVWLDELQRYLDGEHGLTGAVVRALLGAPDPVVLIGTLWPDRYTAYAAIPASGGADPHAREREVLDLAAVIRIGPAFSPTERALAQAAAARDPRLKEALGAAGYGLTQTLAAAPQLVARWEDAQTANPYAWAVLTAALDAARLGARAPLTAGFLRAAAPGYCTSAQQAGAPDNWFGQALAYTIARLHGAAAALSPTGAGMGQIDGFTVADYLLQHASRERRSARVPGSTWDALLSHIRDSGDAAVLAASAEDRLLYCYAIPLYQRATGDRYAVMRLATLLAGRRAGRGDLDELRTRADAGDKEAAERLAHLLAVRGDLDELRTRADAGDKEAAERLAHLLAVRGDLDELRTRADAGDKEAAMQLARLLAVRGDLDELRTRADAGDEEAAMQLARLLAVRGDLDGAQQILRTRADAAAKYVTGLPGGSLLTEGPRGLDRLRARADGGDEEAAERLAYLLAVRRDLDELRTRADAGDRYAPELLAHLLAGRGDLDGAVQILRTRADAGDWYAAMQLAGLLAGRGDLDRAVQILRARAVAGQGDAQWLAELLTKQGRGEEADRLRRFGLKADGSIACE